MTLHRTGRSTDYRGSEASPKRYAVRPYNSTVEIIEQFERMAKGLSPVIVQGDQITWVADDTLTDDQREWCWQTAQQIRREAELGAAKRAKPKTEASVRSPNRTRVDIETLVARVLGRYPDASANLVVVITGLQRPQVLDSDAWILATMGRGVKG